MCGILGLFSFTNRTYKASELVVDMMDPMFSRGPDGSGIWFSSDHQLCLAHRRLSILDLTLAGHQPMISACKRYVLVLNGEIYNANALRRTIDYPYKGTSDTEVLIACISKWGVHKALEKIIGMFAFGLWDVQERVLTIARDRIGEKPLYYGFLSHGDKKDLIFSSDITSFERHPYFNKELNLDALELYFRLNNVPAPYSIYKDIYKLKPGFMAQISPYVNDDFKLTSYWSLTNQFQNNKNLNICTNPVHQLDLILNEVVNEQMISDVPVGALLSGGIDSTLIVALMQNQRTSPINTYTISFDELDYDEASKAKNVANYIGTNHKELLVRPDTIFNFIPDIAGVYGEPFSDSSQIPQYLVCRLASETVKVVLSGDGGDEIFGGYRRYFMASKLWPLINKVPLRLRNSVAQMIINVPPSRWDECSSYLNPLIPKAIGKNNFGDKIHKIAFMLSASSSSTLYEKLLVGTNVNKYINLDSQLLPKLIDSIDLPVGIDLSTKMMILDSHIYMPNDILVKVDRASMANSLESRAPLLDKRVIEFASSLPVELKVNAGAGKIIIRKLLEKYVPIDLWDRPKMGFSVPIGSWLREELRDWANSLLDINLLSQYPFYNAEQIRAAWLEHLDGKRNHQNFLWNILMLQSWLLNKKI